MLRPAVAPVETRSPRLGPARCRTCSGLVPLLSGCMGEDNRRVDVNQKATQVPFLSRPLQPLAHVLVLVALPEAGFDPLQPGLALLRRPGETLTGHPAGDDGEDVSCPVHDSQLLLD